MLTADRSTIDQTDATAVATTILERLERAWNRGDGPGFGAEFAGESDFVDIRGGHHRGDGAIGRGHQALFETIYADSTVSLRLDMARVVAPGCLVAVVSAALDAPHAPPMPSDRSRMTLVIAKQPGRWAVSAFQNTLVTEAG